MLGRYQAVIVGSTERPQPASHSPTPHSSLRLVKSCGHCEVQFSSGETLPMTHRYWTFPPTLRLHFANLHVDKEGERTGLPVTVITVEQEDSETSSMTTTTEDPLLKVVWRHPEAEQLLSGEHPLQWNPTLGPVLHTIPMERGTTYMLQVVQDDSEILVKYPFHY